MIILKNLLFAACLIFTSCNGSRYLSSKANAKEITELEVFRPLSFIALVEKGNKGNINDSISLGLEKIITKELFDTSFFKAKLNPIIIKDEYVETQLEYEIIKVSMGLAGDLNIRTTKIPPRIFMALKSRGKRFGLIVLCNGFTRTKENYKKEVKDPMLKSAIETVILNTSINGLFISIMPGAGSSISLSVLIVDVEKNNIAYFRESTFSSLNVLDQNLINKEIRKLVSKYLRK